VIEANVNTRSLLSTVLAGAFAVIAVVAAARAQNAAVDKAIAAKSGAGAETAAPWVPSRLSDGQPDVQGHWSAEVSGTYSLLNPRKGGTRLQEQLLERAGKKVPTKPTRIVDPPDGQVPYQSWARAKQQEIQTNIDNPTAQRHIDPQARCLPNGPLRSPLWSNYEIMQSPGNLVFSYETTHMYRIVPLDGRPHPSQNVKLWMGDSRGHWEGHTLVIDVTNHNEQSWLDQVGAFHSDALHVVERWTFVGPDAIDYEATLEDAKVYARPWKIGMNYRRNKQKGYEQMESAVWEGNRATELMVHPAPAAASGAK
jgi:hypothetical protein